MCVCNVYCSTQTVYVLCICADLASVDAMLTIHSCKALLVSTLTLSTTCLADAIIQLAIAKGERHEVRLLWSVNS